jgi:hypothetical protein
MGSSQDVWGSQEAIGVAGLKQSYNCRQSWGAARIIPSGSWGLFAFASLFA